MFTLLGSRFWVRVQVRFEVRTSRFRVRGSCSTFRVRASEFRVQKFAFVVRVRHSAFALQSSRRAGIGVCGSGSTFGVRSSEFAAVRDWRSRFRFDIPRSLFRVRGGQGLAFAIRVRHSVFAVFRVRRSGISVRGSGSTLRVRASEFGVQGLTFAVSAPTFRLRFSVRRLAIAVRGSHSTFKLQARRSESACELPGSSAGLGFGIQRAIPNYGSRRFQSICPFRECAPEP